MYQLFNLLSILQDSVIFNERFPVLLVLINKYTMTIFCICMMYGVSDSSFSF